MADHIKTKQKFKPKACISFCINFIINNKCEKENSIQLLVLKNNFGFEKPRITKFSQRSWEGAK